MRYHQSTNVVLHLGCAIAVLRDLAESSVDAIFADPPYLLSNGGISCQSGRMVSVNKGDWDVSNGFSADYEWHKSWLQECKRVLKPNGTIWVSGTHHNIYQIGHAMQALDYRILNEISWIKPNAPPNLSCRYFTHSHETILWASKSKKARHTFNYELVKEKNAGKQMRSFWTFTAPRKREKSFGRHPTQKPLSLLELIVLSSTNPDDVVLDPFAGSGTTGVAAISHGRRFIGIDNNEEYLSIASKRIEAIERS